MSETIGAGALALEEFPPESWVIPGVLPDDAEKILITGPSKAGKSWVAQELAYTLGTGEPWLGLYKVEHVAGYDDAGNPVIEPGMGTPERTLYVQVENTRRSMSMRQRAILNRQHYRDDSWASRLRWQSQEPDEVTKAADNTTLWFPEQIDLSHPDGAEMLRRRLEDADYANVVLDSMYKLTLGGFNDEKAVLGIVNLLDSLPVKRVIAIHHASSNTATRASKSAMGFTWFTDAWADLNIRMRRDKSGEVVFNFEARDHVMDAKRVAMVGPGVWEQRDPAGRIKELGERLGDWLSDHNLTLERKGKGYAVRGWPTDQLRAELEMTEGELSLAKSYLLDTA